VSWRVSQRRIGGRGVQRHGAAGGRRQQLPLLRADGGGLRHRQGEVCERRVPPADDRCDGEGARDESGHRDADVLRSRRGGARQRCVVVDGRRALGRCRDGGLVVGGRHVCCEPELPRRHHRLRWCVVAVSAGQRRRS
jgi:hypothetical protein